MRTSDTTEQIGAKYKYTLWHLYQNLTRAEQREAIITLSRCLGISQGTFENWMYIRKDDNKNIPADCLYQLSTFFNVPVEQMWNEPPKSLYLERLKITSKTASV